jgi:hypothetical protein
MNQVSRRHDPVFASGIGKSIFAGLLPGLKVEPDGNWALPLGSDPRRWLFLFPRHEQDPGDIPLKGRIGKLSPYFGRTEVLGGAGTLCGNKGQ